MPIVSPEADILDALSRHANSITGGYPIANLGVSFTPPETGSYLQIDQLPNGFSFEGLGAGRTFQGIMQITVVSPKTLPGVQCQEIGGHVSNHFAKGTRIYGNEVIVTITNNPVVNQSFQDEKSTRTPITITYKATEATQ